MILFLLPPLTYQTQIYAGLYNGKERFKKSGGRTFDEDGDQEEKERLDNFAHWLVEGEDEEAVKK